MHMLLGKPNLFSFFLHLSDSSFKSYLSVLFDAHTVYIKPLVTVGGNSNSNISLTKDDMRDR